MAPPVGRWGISEYADTGDEKIVCHMDDPDGMGFSGFWSVLGR